MKVRARLSFAATAIAVAGFLVASVAPAGGASGVPFTNSAVDKVWVSGSDTSYALMNDLANAYMESDGCLLTSASFPLNGGSPTQNRCQAGSGAAIAGDNIYENYDHEVIINYFPQGSDVGRGQLCNQKSSSDGGADRDDRVPLVDVARSSSAPSWGFQCTVANGGETGTVLRFVAFARDAITWTRWNGGGSAGVNDLSVAQLNDIFVDCTITDWGQVGGTPGRPIVVYTSIAGSGTRSTWDLFIGGNSSLCIPPQLKDGNVANGERVVRPNQMAPVRSALNDPAAANEGNSIYYMSTGIHASNPGAAASSIIGRINGVQPTEATIVSGEFAFSRNLYNVVRQAGPAPVASGAVQRFVGMNSLANPQNKGWICKGEQHHSEQLGSPNPVGIETATATQDWFEVKKAAFVRNGMYQLPPDANGHRCNFVDVTVS